MSSTMNQYGAVRAQSKAAVRDGRLAERAGRWLRQAWQAYTSRAALAELDERALQDLGISRAQARFEASRAFWDIAPPASREG